MICSHPRSCSLPVGNRPPAHDHFSLDNAVRGGLGRSPVPCSTHSDHPFARMTMSARQHLPVALSAMLVLPTFTSAQEGEAHGPSAMQALVDQYAVFTLEADLSHLSENDRQVVRLLIEAARPMDGVFWQQAYGDKEAALALAAGDEATRRFIEINYGALGQASGRRTVRRRAVAAKPAGRQLLPRRHERRTNSRPRPPKTKPFAPSTRWCAGASDGALVAHPYREAFAEAHTAAAAKLREAAELAERPRPRPLPHAARRRPRDRRLPAERHGVARHEGQPHRRRDRSDRDVRGPALRRQGPPTRASF